MNQSLQPTPSSGIRVFNACLLSFLLIMMPFVQLASAERRKAGAPRASEVKEQTLETQAAAENSFVDPSLPGPIPAPLAPIIVATKDDGLAAATPVAPGGAITYTINIQNNGAASPADDATNVQFNDTVDPHTTILAGSAVAAVSDRYSTIGNTQISVPDGSTDLLGNDFDPDTGNNAGMTVTGYGAATGTEQTSMGSPTATAQNGSVTVNANGSFTYDPPLGFEGTDTFKYRADSGSFAAITTVTITIAGMIWYVNNNAGACPGAPCNGRLSHPFPTLAAFQAVNNGTGSNPAAGDNIFLFESSPANDYVGPVTLLNTQKFIGQDATDSLATITGLTAPSGTDPFPVMNSGNAAIVNITSAADAINLGQNNVLRGFNVGTVPNANIKIDGSGFGQLTIGKTSAPDVSTSGTGRALSLVNGTLAVTSGLNSVASTGSSGAAAILLSQISSGTVTIVTTSVSGATAGGVEVNGSSANINFGDTTVNTGGTDGVVLANNAAGTRTFGILAITGGSGIGFRHFDPDGLGAAVGGGTTTVTGTTNVTNSGTVGISIASNTTLVTFTGATTVTNSGTTGISVDATTALVSFGNANVTGSGGTGVSFTNTTNANGDLTFADLDISPDANQAGLVANTNVGTLTSTTGDISTTNAVAVSSTSSVLSLALNSVSAANSGGSQTAINLTTTTGTFSSSAGTITGGTNPAVLLSGGSVQVTYGGGITQASNAALLSVTGSNTSAVNFNGNLGATNGTGLQFDNADGTYNFNATNTLNGGDAGVDILNGSEGTFSFSTTTSITNPSGAGFLVNGSNPGVTYSGNITKDNVANTAGALVDITNQTGGTITFQTGTLSSTSTSATATGIQLTNADGTVNFNGTTTLNGGDAGVDILTGSAGTISFGTGTTITRTNVSGIAFNLVGSDANVTYSGSMNISGATNGNMIVIDNHDAGTVTFQTGTLTRASGTTQGINVANCNGGTINFNSPTISVTTSGTGIAVQLSTNNDGGIMNFTPAAGGNGLDIVSASGNGFNANAVAGDGGTVTVTGSDNTISSGSGTALNISNTTIGVNDLTFRSISANGASSGIVLNATGSSGGLTVTGANTLTVGGDASGGTIQNTTSHGVSLTNTRDVSFTNLTIQTTGGSGIDGTTVTNFTFKNGTITGSGDAVFESNIAFNDDAAGTENNVSGVLTVTNNTLNTAFDGGLDVRNGNGTISDAVVTGNSITSTTSTTTSKGSGIRLEFKGSAAVVANLTKATITGNTVTNFPSSAGIKVLGGNANAAGPSATIGNNASATDFINIATNSVSGQSAVNRMGTNAIETAVSGKGIGHIVINNNNPLQHVAGVGAALSAFGNVTVKGKITNNTIIANNTVNSSGIAAGADQTFGTTDTPNLTLEISGNNVSAAQGNGILTGIKNTNGTAKIKVLNNTIAAPTVGARPGIRADAGTNLGGDTTLCLEISGNTTAGSGGSPGIGVRKEGTVASTNEFGIVGLSPSPNNPNGTEDDLGTMNPGSAFGAAGFSNDGLRTVRAIVLAGDNYVSCAAFVVKNEQSNIVTPTVARAWAPTDLFNVASEAELLPLSDATNVSSTSTNTLTTAAITREMSTSSVSQASFLKPIAIALTDSARDAGARIAPNAVAHSAEVSSERSDVSEQRSEVRAHHAISSKLETRNSKPDEESGLRAHSATLSKLATWNTNPAAAPAAAMAPCGPITSSHVCVDIPTVAAGGTATITFQVTVNDPPNLTLLTPNPRVENQGTVTADGGISVNTDDPETGTAGDKTATRIDLYGTTTTVQTSGSPSDEGDPVTFTATIAANNLPSNPPGGTNPTGTVQFLDGATPITCNEGGTSIQTLNGSSQATCTTSALTSAGSPHTINVNYSGDGNFEGQTGNVSQTVNTCTPNPVVTKIADTNDGVCDADCSLREAIATTCSANTITFATGVGQAFENAQTITLTLGELSVARNVTIDGPDGANHVTVAGGGTARVFNINASKTVTIRDLTISGGTGPADGGGIFNLGTLNLIRSTISGNNLASNYGGGIFNGVGAVMNINDSTISGNTVGAGVGGGGVRNEGTMNITNSTISGNGADDGGGINNSAGTLTITNSTITNNRADNDNNGAGVGGGIFVGGGTVTLRNSIVQGNFNEDSPSADADDDISGVMNGGGNSTHNRIGTCAGCALTDNLDNNELNVTAAELNLGVLDNNGGPTLTHALGVGSIAIDAGNNAQVTNPPFAGPPFTDQRLLARIVDGPDGDATATVDIGAVEVNYIIAATAGTPQSTTIGTAFPTALEATVSESGIPISGVSVTFTAPGAGASGTFAGSGTATETVSTNGSGVATASTFTANNTAGSYTVSATATGYNGPADFSLTNNAATTSLTTQVSTASTTVGTPVSDTATLSGGANPMGTITFTVYGPNDATCAGASIFTSAAIPVNGNGNYGSGSFTPTAPGTYRWIATYSGDANNSGIAGACNDANETVTVSTASPTMTTTASAGVAVGGNVSDTATIASGFNPTGTITFNLYGPNDATCAGAPIFTSAAIPVNGNGNYGSGNFTPTAPGTYRWIASYTGDSNNAGVTGMCNDANESVVVSQASPTITTQASGTVTLGGTVSDDATLAGGFNPTGTITFTLYGPDDATCGNAPVFISAAIPVAGNGTYNSGNFTPTAAGTYRWIATYSGDANNTAVAGMCNDANETVTVGLNVSVHDATVAEPVSPNTVDMVFTVTLNAPAAPGGASVQYATANGGATPATGGAACGGSVDYVTKPLTTLTFAAGEQVKSISVTVCSDGTVEPDETFLVNLSSPSGATLANGTATGTIKAANTAGTLLISEIRTNGPGGSSDDFVEIYNNSNTPHTVDSADNTGYGVFKMGADCDATPILVGTIPEGEVIPARGHYLLTGTAYSLNNYGGTNAARGDNDPLSPPPTPQPIANIETDRNVGLFATASVTAISSVNRLDAIGFGSNVGNNCNLLREGTPITGVGGLGSTEHSYFRKLCDFAGGCTTPGIPKDTNTNTADFMLADTAGTDFPGYGRHLGAPGPENLASPIRRDPAIQLLLLDSSVAQTAVPNRFRDANANPGNSDFGTLSVRRRILNSTGGPVSRIRFRVVEITTLQSSGPGVADMRAITSPLSSFAVGPVGDSGTCGAEAPPGSPPCTVTVKGTTLETPPTQVNGGGLNSSITVTLGTPLANGQSVNVELLLGVMQTGTFRFLIIVEALP